MEPLNESGLQTSPSLGELTLLFFRLGATSFGGPAAHIALMDNEIVRRRGWIDEETFLDLLGATNLIPGPNSTEMAIHIGHKLHGWRGSIAAGTAFITPAVSIVLLLSWVYVEYASLPALSGVLYGIKPVMIAIVAQALWTLGRTCLRTKILLASAFLDLAALVWGVHELAVLFGTGIALAILEWGRTWKSSALAVYFPILAFQGGEPVSTFVPAATEFSLKVLFLTFLKIGSVLFGSGYVLLAYLDTDFVVRLGWLDKRQLLDAITVGQITPGPLFSTATFIGYVLAGTPGAILATVGIFLPSFVFVALSAPIVPRLRRSRVTGAFLNGVNVASWVLMAGVTIDLARDSLVDPLTVGLSSLCLVALIVRKVNSTWLILLGAAIGLAIECIR